jgi:hypothetical protein
MRKGENARYFMAAEVEPAKDDRIYYESGGNT